MSYSSGALLSAIQPCDSNPCGENAICTPGEIGAANPYSCACAPGYTGKEVDDSKPCVRKFGCPQLLTSIPCCACSLWLFLVGVALSCRTCEQLGWVGLGSREVCGQSLIQGNCSGPVSHATAERICTGAGARLCTIAELEGRETSWTGCG